MAIRENVLLGFHDASHRELVYRLIQEEFASVKLAEDIDKLLALIGTGKFNSVIMDSNFYHFPRHEPSVDSAIQVCRAYKTYVETSGIGGVLDICAISSAWDNYPIPTIDGIPSYITLRILGKKEFMEERIRL